MGKCQLFFLFINRVAIHTIYLLSKLAEKKKIADAKGKRLKLNERDRQKEIKRERERNKERTWKSIRLIAEPSNCFASSLQLHSCFMCTFVV